MNEQDLSALVSSRICHDLISPIGAISNGVELMTDLGGNASPELDLIGESVNSATVKLRYFRIAFGAAKSGSRAQVSELHQVLGAMFQGRTTATLSAQVPDIPRITAKLALLALLCAERSLPMGGTMELSLHGTGFTLRIASDRLNPVAELWGMLDSAPTEDTTVASGDVQFLLLATSAQLNGAVISTEFSSNVATIKATEITP